MPRSFFRHCERFRIAMININRAIPLSALAALCLIQGFLHGCSKETPEKFISSGKAYLSNGDVRAAIVEFKNAVQLAPDSPEPRYMLGVALGESEDPVSAEVELRKALDKGYAPDLVYPVLARTLLQHGQPDKALVEASAQVQADSSKAELIALSGLAHLALGKPDEAREAFAAALKVQPTNDTGALGLARLAIADGNLPRAQQLIDEILRRSPSSRDALLLNGDLLVATQHEKEAIEAYKKTIQLRPYSTRAYLSVVPLLLRAGDVESARKNVEALRKLAPRSAAVLYLEAQVAYTQGDKQRARDDIEAVLKAVPNHIPALTLGGMIAHDTGSYSQAEQYLRKVVAADPTKLYPRRLLVSTYLHMNQAERAKKEMATLLELAPTDNSLLALAGEVALANRDRAKASEYYQKVLAADPNNAAARGRLGQLRLASGDTEQAIKDLEAASAADMKGYRADVTLIVVHLKRKEFDKAQAIAEALVKKQPDNPLAYNVLGMVRLSQNDQAGGRMNFAHALQIQSSYFAAARNLAVLDMRDGHADAAKQRYESVLAKDPKNEPAALALVELLDINRASAEEVEKLIDRAIQANPGSARPWVVKVTYWLQHDDPQKALTTARQAQAALPQDQRLLDLLARTQMAAGEYDQAIASFGKLAGLMPKSAAPLMAQAQAYAAAKDWSGARRAVKKAIELEPDSVALQLAMARVESQSERFVEARNEARAIQTRWPTQAAGYVAEAEVLTAQNALPEAEGVLRAAIEKLNDPALVTRLYGLLDRRGRSQEADALALSWGQKNPKDIVVVGFAAALSLQREDYSAAARWYKAAVSAQPKNPGLLNNLAWVLGKLHDPAALQYGEQALTLAPDAPAVLDTVGWLMVEGGNVQKGLEMLKKAHNLAPRAAGIELNLAKALIKAGQAKAAREHLEVLARLPAGAPVRGDAEKLLSSL
ncbi:MAG: PEP-CTERM system TPR-repeat protein PrsT [Proteobacteria bacterium]|nr:MAG: PEP-CTERM system TPR-repeat protein PrsT [Pseudomonadota bacterium]